MRARTIEASRPTSASTAGLEQSERGLAARRRRVKPLLAAADLAVIVVAMTLAYGIREAGGGRDLDGARLQHVLLALGTLPVWLVTFAHRRLYSSRFIIRRIEEWKRILNATGTAVLAMAATGYVLQLHVSRAWLLLVGILTVLAVGVERELVRRAFARFRRRGHLLRDVIIVGSNDEARELGMTLLDDPTLGYRVVGFVDDHTDEPGCDLLGTLQETLDVARRTGAGGVLLAASATSMAVSNRLVRELVKAGIHVELTSTLRDVAAERLTVRPLGPYPVVYLEPRPQAGWRSHAKRVFDVCLAGFGILTIAPLAIAIAVAIKLDSRGPVIFRQTRVGQGGRPFPVYKFRTMVDGAENHMVELRELSEVDGPLFKLRSDPRVTRVGRFLRRTSLDEVPQLFNVVLGHMSLVGPRPALPDEQLAWDEELHDRLRVKPGITGMWQVSGRSDASFASYSRLDLYYVDNWSLLTDLALLAKTVPTVLFGRGAY